MSVAPGADTELERSSRLETGDAHHARSLSMFTSSLALIFGKVATMGLGFLFWLVAARMFDQSAVGLAAAIVSAVMLCTQLALLGLGSSVIVQFINHARRPSPLFDVAFTLVALLGLVAAAVFMGVAWATLGELRVVATDPTIAVAFAAMSVLGTVGILLDQISTLFRRGDQALARAVVFGGVNLAMLTLLALFTSSAGASAIFGTWVPAAMAAVALGTIQLRRSSVRYRYRPRFERRLARRLIRIGLPNHWLTLTERAPGLILPLIVVELLSSEANAAWYVAWMMAWVVYIVPIQVGMTSFAETARRPHELARLARYSVRTSLLVGVPTAAVVAVAANPLLSLLGDDYAAAATTPLRILLLAVVPLSVIQAYFVICRSTGRLAEAIAAGALNAVAGIGGAAVAATSHGLVGIAIAWVAAQVLTSIWAGARVRALAHESSVPVRRVETPTAAPAAVHR
jgi:O-antigen/teichoic acid export membrane protein